MSQIYMLPNGKYIEIMTILLRFNIGIGNAEMKCTVCGKQILDGEDVCIISTDNDDFGQTGDLLVWNNRLPNYIVCDNGICSKENKENGN